MEEGLASKAAGTQMYNSSNNATNHYYAGTVDKPEGLAAKVVKGVARTATGLLPKEKIQPSAITTAGIRG
jgi:hypothetical protein